MLGDRDLLILLHRSQSSLWVLHDGRAQRKFFIFVVKFSGIIFTLFPLV